MEDGIRQLVAELGESTVLTGADVPARSAGDWSTAPRQMPLAYVRPANAAEAGRAIAICRAAGLTVVPQGGLTGLCGGANPSPGSVVVSTERMVGIESIDRDGATMTVRAGTALETVQLAAEEAGFIFPMDLGARGSCTIGGNIATNAGGLRVIRYGMTRNLVLGLEAVLPDGTVLDLMNSSLKNNSGYDLKQMFFGSEGTLGLVTRAVLRLVPKPQKSVLALCGLATFNDMLTFLRRARADMGGSLAAFEGMWSDFWEVVTTRIGRRSPLETRQPFHVLIEFHGAEADVDGDRIEGWLAGLLEEGVLQDVALAQSIAQMNAFWTLRETGAEFGDAIGPCVSYDLGMPVAQMDSFAATCRARLAEKGFASIWYGHIGDGNMHTDVWTLDGSPLDKAVKNEMDEIVYGSLPGPRGIVSAEHGIGTMKTGWLECTRDASEMESMRTLKRAFDPQNLFNPGKVFI